MLDLNSHSVYRYLKCFFAMKSFEKDDLLHNTLGLEINFIFVCNIDTKIVIIVVILNN